MTTTYENAQPYDQPITTNGKVSIAKPMRSTLSAATLGLTMAAAIHVPLMNAPTFQPSYVEETAQSIQHQVSEASIYGFVVAVEDFNAVNEYLTSYPLASVLLAELRPILKSVYNKKVDAKINILDDPDTGSPLIEVVILSGLPINDEFGQKDRLVFEGIQHAGLSEGLQHVVISQG